MSIGKMVKGAFFFSVPGGFAFITKRRQAMFPCALTTPCLIENLLYFNVRTVLTNFLFCRQPEPDRLSLLITCE